MRVLVICLMFSLTACAATPPDPAATPAGEPTGERRVHFECDNGEKLEMRFFPLQGVGVLVRAGRTHELQQQPAASGFYYAGGDVRVRGKGNDLQVETDGALRVECHAL